MDGAPRRRPVGTWQGARSQSRSRRARKGSGDGRTLQSGLACTLAQSWAALPGVEAGVGVNGITVWGERELSGQGTRWNLIAMKIATA